MFVQSRNAGTDLDEVWRTNNLLFIYLLFVLTNRIPVIPAKYPRRRNCGLKLVKYTLLFPLFTTQITLLFINTYILFNKYCYLPINPP